MSMTGANRVKFSFYSAFMFLPTLFSNAIFKKQDVPQHDKHWSKSPTGGHWWSFSNGARANFRIVLDPPEIVLIDMTLNVVQDTIVFSDGQVFDNDFYFDHRTTQRLI